MEHHMNKEMALWKAKLKRSWGWLLALGILFASSNLFGCELNAATPTQWNIIWISTVWYNLWFTYHPHQDGSRFCRKRVNDCGVLIDDTIVLP